MRREPNHELRDLRGRTAIVTGAGKGLGRAYALHLASRGANVLVNNRRHPGEADSSTSAQQTVDAIRRAGGAAVPNWADVREPDSGNQMVTQVLAQFGGLDIVVANAGSDKAAGFHKQSLAEFRDVFDVGFFGNLHLAHAAWPHLVGQNYGRVILTTSSAGLYANHGQAAYSAAKSAVIGLMRTLAIEGRRFGVKVNAIAPYAYSQMTAPYMTGEMQSAFNPDCVSPLLGWLASPDCDVSGEVLVSGAGWLRRAEVGETTAIRFDEDAPGHAATALKNSPVHAYACANDSFAAFLKESRLPTQEKTL